MRRSRLCFVFLVNSNHTKTNWMWMIVFTYRHMSDCRVCSQVVTLLLFFYYLFRADNGQHRLIQFDIWFPFLFLSESLPGLVCLKSQAWPVTGLHQPSCHRGRQPQEQGPRCFASCLRPTRWMKVLTSGFMWNHNLWKSSMMLWVVSVSVHVWTWEKKTWKSYILIVLFVCVDNGEQNVNVLHASWWPAAGWAHQRNTHETGAV